MAEPLTHCFHCNDAFQKVERNGVGVPRNVPCSTNGTGAIRSKPHSPLGSVWKLLGQIKFASLAPVNVLALMCLNASRVPALGCGWEYLVLRGLQAYSDDQRQIPDIGSRKPRIIADPMVSKLFCISILSNCDWIAPLSAGVCSDICDVSAHADNEMQRAVTVSSFFIFLCLPPHYDTNKLGSLCKYLTRVRLFGVALPHSEFPKDLPRLLCPLIGGRHSGFCVPFRHTVLAHFVCAVFQFFPALLIRHNVNCRCSTHGSCGYASHKDIGCHKLQRKQHSNLPDDVFVTDVGECAGYAICILSRTQIKVSGVPLTKNDALGRLNASCVPALGCGCNNLN